MRTIKTLNKEQAKQVFEQGKSVYHLVCKNCHQEFYFASNKKYGNQIILSCPSCMKPQKIYLEDIKNYKIEKWQFN